MMTVYTGINVPYGAMLGVMTDDSQEKTVFSSFRMFFAYGGSFIALFASGSPLQVLLHLDGHVGSRSSWQFAMIVIAACCFVLFLLCFNFTREQLTTVSSASLGKDLKALLTNKPPVASQRSLALLQPLQHRARCHCGILLRRHHRRRTAHSHLLTLASLLLRPLPRSRRGCQHGRSGSRSARHQQIRQETHLHSVDALLIIFSVIFFTLSPESNGGLLMMLLLPNSHLGAHRRDGAARMVNVCRYQRLLRTENPLGLYRPHLLLGLYGP